MIQVQVQTGASKKVHEYSTINKKLKPENKDESINAKKANKNG